MFSHSTHKPPELATPAIATVTQQPKGSTVSIYSKEFRQRRAELAEVGLRECNRCRVVKSLESDFDNDTRGANGKAGHCKECRNASSRERHHRYGGLQGAIDNGYKRAGRHGRRRRKFSPEHLLKTWAKRGIDPWVCFYTGVELTAEPGHPNTRQIDHVEPLSLKGSAGHVSTNIVPCSAEYNLYKASGRAVVKHLDAPEELRPARCFIGLPHGGVDEHGNPNAPAVAVWEDTDHGEAPPRMGFCQWLKTFASA